MSVLVTGGAGYIGSHTVRQLRGTGADVVVLDSLEFGHEAALLGTELVVGDIADRSLVTDLCRRHGVTQVVHFAAYKSRRRVDGAARPSYWHNNVAGTVGARRGRCSRPACASSCSRRRCSVYGTPAVVPVDETPPSTRERVRRDQGDGRAHARLVRPVTSGLRVGQPALLQRRRRQRRRPHRRGLAQVAEPRPAGDEGRCWARRRALKVFGTDYPTPDGTCIRDYIHVDDLAGAHLAAARPPRRRRRHVALNVGTGIGTQRAARCIDATERIAGRTVPVRDRRPACRRPRVDVRRPDDGAQTCSAGRPPATSTRSSPAPGRWHSTRDPDG